ncbi:MAG TPA: thiamine pyrophosphate-dependent enzyme [Acidimicrobiia bacterium]|jgi:thiamine pyrophosphate-dependent acetolactate synthase large subunit-like protein
MIERMDVLRALARHRTDEVVVMTMTTTLQWPLVSDSDLDFDFLAFGMGHASDFGLGLALARPERRVIVLKGDGGLLMSLGSLVTIARHGPENLIVLLMENRSYEITGGQPLPERVDFVKLGVACGVEGGGATGRGTVRRIASLSEFEAAVGGLLTAAGPHFVVLPVTNSQPLPAVSHTDHAGRVARLRRALAL